MVEEFAGLPEAAYDVLLKLEGDPSPTQLETHREELERLVRDPMRSLTDALNLLDPNGGPGPFWVSGLGKHWWGWQHQCTTAWIARRVRITVRFDLDGLHVEGGWTGGAESQLPRYRSMVAAEHSGIELAEIVAELRAAGFELTGSTLTRTPRGYPAEHPRAELLRRRSLFASKPLGAHDWLHTPEVVDRVRMELAPLYPLTSWLVDYVAIAGFAPER